MRVVLIEPNDELRQTLLSVLTEMGYAVSESSDLQSASQVISRGADLIVAEHSLSDGSAADLIQKVMPTPVILMSESVGIMSIIQAMRLGAVNYLIKPFDQDYFVRMIASALAQTVPGLKGEAHEETYGIVGDSGVVRLLFSHMKRVAPTSATVLICGESGTGKELVAAALHKLSDRQAQPFITVNCAALPDSLMESELFGHEKGAFTGANAAHVGLVEAAHKGTLFLDEISELSLAAQARLLRVIQEQEVRRVGAVHSRHVDFRLIVASNQDLYHLVQKERFREDLYHRLNIARLQVPALRDRAGDIQQLADYFLTRLSARYARRQLSFDPACYQAMRHYSWHGNIRELENAIERAVIFASSSCIRWSDFNIQSKQSASTKQSLIYC